MAEQDRWRVLAIDYGTKRIGIALSDEGRMLATARGTIANDTETIKNLQRLIAKEDVRVVVLGIPTTLRNTDSEMTLEVRKFEAKLRESLVGIEIVTRDERLTSVMAGVNVASRGMKKSRREQKGLHDEEAARILLQEYLDNQ